MKNKFAQQDKDTPFGRHLKEVTRYLDIGIPSFTGMYNATLPEGALNDSSTSTRKDVFANF